MDAQLLDALADILADALLADLEAEVAEVEAVSVSTAQSPTGSGSENAGCVDGSLGRRRRRRRDCRVIASCHTHRSQHRPIAKFELGARVAPRPPTPKLTAPHPLRGERFGE